MTIREPNILRIAAKKIVEDLGPTLQQTQIAALLGRTGKHGLSLRFEPTRQVLTTIAHHRDHQCRVMATLRSRGDVAIATSRDARTYKIKKSIQLADPDVFTKVHRALSILLRRDARRLWTREVRQRFWSVMRVTATTSNGSTPTPDVRLRCVFKPTGPSIAFADPDGAIWCQGGTSQVDVLTAALAYARRSNEGNA